MLKRLSPALPAALFAALLAVPPSTAAPAPSATPRPAQTVYAEVCGYCHGRNVGPILLGRMLPADYIAAMVRTGRNGMPAFRPTEVSPQELEALAAWISSADADPEEHGQ
jgi:mono/diheme cytochrome c family protein